MSLKEQDEAKEKGDLGGKNTMSEEKEPMNGILEVSTAKTGMYQCFGSDTTSRQKMNSNLS